MVRVFIVLLISFNLFAYKAVITVLEAPLFRQKDMNSHVIQYARKGDEIYIHKTDNSEEFFKTLTRTGDEAYILKDHVYVYYESSRELDQFPTEHDDTDYRIPEPLPEKYPIRQLTGFRGQFFINFGSFNNESYNYDESVLDSSNDSYFSMHFLWSKEAELDLSKRFFFGAFFTVYNSTTTYLLANNKSTENNVKIGAGPYLSYDVWKNNKHMLTLFSSIQVYLFDRLTIEYANESNYKYSAISLGIFNGLNYAYRDFIGDFDFISGVSANISPPKTYDNDESPLSGSLNSSFKTRFNGQIGLFLGIQSDY